MTPAEGTCDTCRDAHPDAACRRHESHQQALVAGGPAVLPRSTGPRRKQRDRNRYSAGRRWTDRDTRTAEVLDPVTINADPNESVTKWSSRLPEF